jgi:predicted adenylyl cyclase CyaB
MMRNLEAKFRLSNLETARAQVESIGFTYRASLVQCDTFFVTRSGKLKLREQNDGASLIYYQRDRRSDLELSHYSIIEVTDPSALREMLSAALGMIAQVSKQRVLLMRNNIRLHLDDVAQLGTFGEIEVVLNDGELTERYAPVVEKILVALKISAADLIYRSYFELMATRT